MFRKKLMAHIPILVLFCCSNIYARSSEKILSRDQIDTLNYLTRAPRAAIRHKRAKLRFAEALRQKVLLEDVRQSHLYTALLRAGTIVQDLKDKENYYLPKDTYIKLHHKADKDGFKYIVNSKKKLRFKVHDKDVINIKQITNMKIKPKKFLKTPYKKHLLKETKKANFIHEINIGVGTQSTPFLKEMLRAEKYSVFSARFNYAVYAITDLPVEVGAEFSSSSDAISHGMNSSSSLTTVSIGPKFRYNASNTSKPFYWITGFRKSVFSRVAYTREVNSEEIGAFQTSLDTNSFHFGFEKFYTKNIPFGINYNKIWYHTKSSNDLLNLSSKSKTGHALFVHTGYKF